MRATKRFIRLYFSKNHSKTLEYICDPLLLPGALVHVILFTAAALCFLKALRMRLIYCCDLLSLGAGAGETNLYM